MIMKNPEFVAITNCSYNEGLNDCAHFKNNEDQVKDEGHIKTEVASVHKKFNEILNFPLNSILEAYHFEKHSKGSGQERPGRREDRGYYMRRRPVLPGCMYSAPPCHSEEAQRLKNLSSFDD